MSRKTNFNERQVLSKNLQYYRMVAGITQTQAASIIEISRPTYGSYEEGRAMPPYSVLIKMVEVFSLQRIEELTKVRPKPKGWVIKRLGLKDKIYSKYVKLPMEQRKIIDFILKLNVHV